MDADPARYLSPKVRPKPRVSACAGGANDGSNGEASRELAALPDPRITGDRDRQHQDDYHFRFQPNAATAAW